MGIACCCFFVKLLTSTGSVAGVVSNIFTFYFGGDLEVTSDFFSVLTKFVMKGEELFLMLSFED
jgi:hypothetical protein